MNCDFHVKNCIYGFIICCFQESVDANCNYCIYQMHVFLVVTGSTHGIGKAYAQELAARKFNIVIISLGEDECSAMATMLGNQK